MESIRTARVILRPFRETDYDDLDECLSQLRDDPVGYIVNRNYQRMGNAAEALSAVIGSAFQAGAHRVYAECDPRNIPSWKLLEHVGLRREAHFKQNIFFHRDKNGAPVWKDTFVYAIIAEEWEQAKGGRH